MALKNNDTFLSQHKIERGWLMEATYNQLSPCIQKISEEKYKKFFQTWNISTRVSESQLT